MHSKTHRTLLRVERALGERVEKRIYSQIAPLEVEAWAVGGEPIPPEIALGLGKGDLHEPTPAPQYAPFPVGAPWGAPWDTTWFRFSGIAPKSPTSDGTGDERDGRERSGSRTTHSTPVAPSEMTDPAPSTDPAEIVIDLGWDPRFVGFQAEGLVYRPDGSIVKALNPRTRWIPLSEVSEPGQPFTFYVEAASNPLIGGGPWFEPTPYSAKPAMYEGALYTLRSAEICQYHREVAELATDLQVLEGLARVLPEDSARRERILIAIERALNVFDGTDVDTTAKAARELLRPVLDKPANASAHLTSAMGHAHIDSAWLWPTRETERKVARTVANVVELLEEHEDFIFTMSSAQQYVWLERRYPELFAKLARFVAAGRIVPVGGMWVEPDGMLPSGESYARQILLGQHYFKEKFGAYCDLMWLPDSFGYSGALPQLAKLGRMDRFLTQKISWNDTNTFPHHSFWWEGIDGTRVLTHFPPSDTYNAEVTAAELDRAARNYRDKGISDNSILLFGYGDGGGGPTREMIARTHRFADLEDASKVLVRTPQEFFEDLAVELAEADSSWTGELYLEMHRGTFTSQSDTKVGNRRNEALITQVEAAWTRAALAGHPYPHQALEAAWQTLLLNQFHDILPGSSINWVHADAVRDHQEVNANLRGLLAEANAVLDDSEAGRGTAKAAPIAATARVREVEGGFILEDDHLRAKIDPAGTVTSLLDKKRDRELVPDGRVLGELALYRDEPVTYDAWDIDRTALDTKQIINDVQSLGSVEEEDGPGVRVRRSFGESEATLTYRLNQAGGLEMQLEVDWNEEEKLLKLLFPFDLHANSARFETQFGYVERPIHENTSWDAARFEVCAHRYLHLSEPGFGVGVVNDAAYGYSVGKPASGGVEVGASVLKSAKYPDPTADRGKHTKRWAIVPSPDLADVIDAAEELNASSADHLSLIARIEDPTRAVRLSAAKMARDGSGDIILRVYESLGSRAHAQLVLDEAFGGVQVSVVDLLEEPVGIESADSISAGSLTAVNGRRVDVELHPFQVLTLRIARA